MLMKPIPKMHTVFQTSEVSRTLVELEIVSPALIPELDVSAELRTKIERVDLIKRAIDKIEELND
ncbi:hypothetical protein TUMSATVNIG1_60040 (plasmid) [Vibrio nigripulchritudo]|nr:hypothetical protein VNTUMSATTG_59550 [Vibrio nigripulchritudo]BDU35395.1 hypothetical protein TUMSATVNIG1_60040 [Vibrio nigripulchritudo]